MKTGFANMPGGSAGAAATLGGFGLAVSAHSAHRQEAIKYLLFLIRAKIQSGEKSQPSGNQPRVYDGPLALGPYSQFDERGSTLVSRPAIETGRDYRKVSAAYAAAVHSVLTGQKSAPEAAAELEAQLINMTGFHVGGPKQGTSSGAPLRNGSE